MRLSVLSRTALDGALILLLLLTGWRVLDSRSRTTIVHLKNSVTTPSVRRGDILREQAGASPLDNSQQLHELSMEDTKHIRNVRLLDVRSHDRFDAGHLPGARNIPAAELPNRAEIELKRTDPVVVDCLYPQSTGCRAAAWGLIRHGFSDVGVLIK